LTKELCRRNADAAVIIRAKAERKYLENLQSNRFPFVCVYDGPHENTITLNDHLVGELALNHLVELGHTRIAIARNVGRRASSGRFMGFVQAAAIRGLAADAVTEVIPSKLGTGYEVGHEILREWIAQNRPWSAIFCTSDNVATGILSQAVQQGIQIPSELSVLTCDDIVSNAEAAPPLSVVDIPNQQAGYLAAQHAWEILTGDSSSIKLPAPLTVEHVIARASTAAP
jgi:DNA-binding LacI/PurR family transcriptional regulator